MVEICIDNVGEVSKVIHIINAKIIKKRTRKISENAILLNVSKSVKSRPNHVLISEKDSNFDFSSKSRKSYYPI